MGVNEWTIVFGPDGSYTEYSRRLTHEEVDSLRAQGGSSLEADRIVRRLVKWGTDPDLPDGPNPPITAGGFDVLRNIIQAAAEYVHREGENT